MVSLWLANGVTAIHAVVVICTVCGVFAAITGVLRRLPRLETAFYLLLAGVVTSQLLRGECILTVWEKSLRNAYRPGAGYHNSCLRHYIPWIPLPVLDVVGPSLIVLAILALPFWRVTDARRRRVGPTKIGPAS